MKLRFTFLYIQLHELINPPISKDNWIKVMVVADGPMLKYHGKKLERYILTLMQTVNSIVFDNTLCVLKYDFD